MHHNQFANDHNSEKHSCQALGHSVSVAHARKAWASPFARPFILLEYVLNTLFIIIVTRTVYCYCQPSVEFLCVSGKSVFNSPSSFRIQYSIGRIRKILGSAKILESENPHIHHVKAML